MEPHGQRARACHAGRAGRYRPVGVAGTFGRGRRSGAAVPADRAQLRRGRHGRAGAPARRRTLDRRAARVPAVTWLLGVGAFFGYHALYFTALQTLPPVEALLIINLWPLLIVLFTSLLPGERLLGVACGLAGAAILVLGKAEPLPDLPEPGPLGYAAAIGCALIWSGYSVLNRRVVADVPSDAVTGFCLATAALSFLAHLALEPSGWPRGWPGSPSWLWGSD
jgi:drug/metabolite transporter (DMT)-like permease